MAFSHNFKVITLYDSKTSNVEIRLKEKNLSLKIPVAAEGGISVGHN